MGNLNFMDHNIMYKIQTNPSGTRSMEITDEQLATIMKYSLFRNLVDSTGFIDEEVLDKLKLNLDKSLLDLCLDVIYHPNMKAFGLHQLVLLYIDWTNQQEQNDAVNEEEKDNR